MRKGEAGGWRKYFTQVLPPNSNVSLRERIPLKDQHNHGHLPPFPPFLENVCNYILGRSFPLLIVSSEFPDQPPVFQEMETIFDSWLTEQKCEIHFKWE